MDHARLADELLRGDPELCHGRAVLLCRHWGLPGTYLVRCGQSFWSSRVYACTSVRMYECTSSRV